MCTKYPRFWNGLQLMYDITDYWTPVTLYVTLARHCDRLQACSEFTIGGSILYRE